MKESSVPFFACPKPSLVLPLTVISACMLAWSSMAAAAVPERNGGYSVLQKFSVQDAPPPPIEEIGVSWGGIHQVGLSGSNLAIASRFELIVVPADGVALESVRFQSPEGVWYDLEFYDDEWEFQFRGATLDEITSKYKAGKYLVEATLQGMDSFRTTVTVADDFEHPESIPQVFTPVYGQSGFGEGSTTLEFTWQAANDPDLDLVVFRIGAINGEEEWDEWMDSDASSIVLENVPLEQAWEGSVIFGNLRFGETDEGVEVFLVRFNEAPIIFDTHTAPDFAILEAMIMGTGSTGDAMESRFEVEFGSPLKPDASDPLIARAALWPPLMNDYILFDANWHGNWDNSIGYHGTEHDWLGIFDRGWYCLMIEFPDGTSAVTPIWYGLPEEDSALLQPSLAPVLLEPAPADGSEVASPVTLAWESLADDPKVTLILAEISTREDFHDPAERSYFPPDATTWGPVDLAANTYYAGVSAVHYYGRMSPHGPPLNPDGIAYDIFNYKRSYRVFSITEETTESGIPLSWLRLHGFPSDGSADHVDLYGKGMTLLEEYIADTNPNDPASVFRVETILMDPHVEIHFYPSSPDRFYTLEHSENLVDWEPVPLQVSIPGDGGPLFDLVPDLGSRGFYRVIVDAPEWQQGKD